MLETFEVGTFAPRVGEPFRIRADEAQWVATTLIEATTMGEGTERPGHRAPFSLVFRGPGPGYLRKDRR
jgi:hypothetical protein